MITGFGKFSVVKRAARNGVNPRTGERVKIKASKAPKSPPGLLQAGRLAKEVSTDPAATRAVVSGARRPNRPGRLRKDSALVALVRSSSRSGGAAHRDLSFSHRRLAIACQLHDTCQRARASEF